MVKITVIGAGGWGTTIANLLARYKGEEVSLWVYPEEKFEGRKLEEIMQKEFENKKFLPQIKLIPLIEITSSLEKAASEAEIIVSAVPSQYLKETAEGMKSFIKKDARVLSLTKGIDLENGKFKRMSEILEETLEIEKERIAVLSGPNIAYEIARGYPTASVIASTSEENAEFLRQIFNMPPILKVYRSSDVTGVELGGALKNPYAIGAGICDFLILQETLGQNSKAAYLTRCLNEMKKFGILLGAKEETFNGLSGLGDLSVTFESKQSRNHRVGYMLANGMSLEKIKEKLKGKIAEGIRTTKHVYGYAESIGHDMNIMKQIYSILYNKKDINRGIADLMNRDTKVE
ncbi:NAD(P)-dependent glycerol-3-phosphate dehydrogenase [Candidatus Pacearchaeota archaeon]|nr:NAD(P)-dependent glycerol-3-phosphate dehydrogenase [Candidatus Pacearchaeota archaeon]